jgi:hypothetical protein
VTPTKERRRFTLRPYRSPWLNAVHMGGWLAVLLIILVGGYVEWQSVVGPGLNQKVLIEAIIVDPHWRDSEGWDWWLPFVPAAVAFCGWGLVQARNRTLGLRLQPFAYALWLGFMLLYEPLHLDERLRFTPTSVSYRWGIAPYTRIATYRWTQPYAWEAQQTQGKTRRILRPTFYTLLTLTVHPVLFMPQTLQWPISAA